MGQGRLVVAFLAAPLAALGSAFVADGSIDVSMQAPPGVPGSAESWVHVTNAGGGAYEQRYGQPINISACTWTDGSITVPQGQSIRVFGRFDPGMMSQRHPEAAAGSTEAVAKPLCDTPGQSVVRTAGNATCRQLVFLLCCEEGQGRCVPVSPVVEMADALEATAESYRNQRVVVVGATDGPGTGFQFWDFQAMADFAKKKAGRSRLGPARHRRRGRASLRAAGACPRAVSRAEPLR